MRDMRKGHPPKVDSDAAAIHVASVQKIVEIRSAPPAKPPRNAVVTDSGARRYRVLARYGPLWAGSGT
jgi:hypothetical protein